MGPGSQVGRGEASKKTAVLALSSVALALVLAVTWTLRSAPGARPESAIAPQAASSRESASTFEAPAPIAEPVPAAGEGSALAPRSDGVLGDVERAERTAGARVTGRVLDDLGHAVAGVRVRLARTAGEQEVETDRQGRFAFEALERGHVRLDVVVRSLPADLCALPSANGPVSSSRMVRIDRETTFEVDLRVSRAAALFGRVVHPDGRGIGGSSVTLSGPGDRMFDALCDAAGAWERAGLAPGRWSLAVDFSGVEERELLATPPPVEVELAPGQRALAPDLVADAWSCVVTGRVLALDGSPWPGLSLACRPKSGAVSVPLARSDEQGRFRLGPLPSGDFELELGAPRARALTAATEEASPRESVSFSTARAPLVHGRRALDLGDLRVGRPRQVTLTGQVRLDLMRVRSERWQSASVQLDLLDSYRNEWVRVLGPTRLDFPPSMDDDRASPPELGWPIYALDFDAEGPGPRLRAVARGDLGEEWTREFAPPIEAGAREARFDVELP